MYMLPQDWLEIIRKEYLRDFIRSGGAAVKFVVPTDEVCRHQVRDSLRNASEEGGFSFALVDAVSTKIHMIDKLFHEVARQVDWDELAYSFVTQVLRENGYELPANREEFNLRQIAVLNKREDKFLRMELHRWLEQKIFHDYEMSQEFRIAMTRLCIAQLDAGSASPFLSNAIKEWLRGELRLIGALKEAPIFQKVVRHNARHLLLSLAHWLRVNGKSGLVLTLDISRYAEATRSRDPDNGFYYSKPATFDAYEVLRQFIDGTDELESCLIVVIVPRDLLTDERRGVNRYNALNLRILDEVRDRNRQNPFSSLIRLSSEQQPQDSIAKRV
jgi:P-loop Domain of unknown function (DUF2791)